MNRNFTSGKAGVSLPAGSVCNAKTHIAAIRLPVSMTRNRHPLPNHERIFSIEGTKTEYRTVAASPAAMMLPSVLQQSVYETHGEAL